MKEVTTIQAVAAVALVAANTNAVPLADAITDDKRVS